MPDSEDGKGDRVYLHPATYTQTSPESSTVSLSISNTFLPTAQLRPETPNLILLASDLTFFYVHSQVLQDASDNRFHSLLPAHSPGSEDEPSILSIPETSPVLNIFYTRFTASTLHIYGINPNQRYASFARNKIEGTGRTSSFVLNFDFQIQPSTPLFTLLLSYAPHVPMDLYSLAGQHNFDDLAVAASAHLLSYDLSRLTDAAAQQMGAIYLKRQVAWRSELFFLHLGRMEALKRALLPPPGAHQPTRGCSVDQQRALAREWALASARLAMDLRPDISTHALELALLSLAAHLTCALCQNTLKARVRNLTEQWAIVKVCSGFLLPVRCGWCVAANDMTRT
ncbi:hypothetical protein B0H16DRAFT_1712728 [Mycena metata]|uniref:BTB domain-containing protein n=1 Tax=Mycena metata TaxID=1033252 RepID=A0AAD7K5Z5_9AGAR|nr:hypothetical protein B0H16DRAFT_1712728 [Mycena metata]